MDTEASLLGAVALGLVNPSEVRKTAPADVEGQVASAHLGEGGVLAVVGELLDLGLAPTDAVVEHGGGVVLGVRARFPSEEKMT